VRPDVRSALSSALREPAPPCTELTGSYELVVISA